MADPVVIAVAFPKPDYVAALEKAGATVHQLRPDLDQPEDVPARFDGILLTGGVDVDPSIYGEKVRHATVDVDAARDAYEIPLARAALAGRMPLLAICRGAQLLNVAAGGTLVQDLPSQQPSAIEHRLRPPQRETTHDVRVEAGTKLAEILGPALDPAGHVLVNSRHHQALGTVAAEFEVTAVAPDGVVEAIERRDAPFCIAVQWHPEGYWRTGEFASLFEALMKAARKQKARRG